MVFATFDINEHFLYNHVKKSRVLFFNKYYLTNMQRHLYSIFWNNRWGAELYVCVDIIEKKLFAELLLIYILQNIQSQK